MKKTSFIVLFIITIFISCLSVYGYGSQEEHDKDLQRVLYGSTDFKLDGELEKCFKNIADAASICIDQYTLNPAKPAKKSLFDDLKTAVGLPYSFESIELKTENVGIGISPNNHRAFTHRGWYFNNYSDQNFWEKRKKILFYTVNKLLFSDGTIFRSIPLIDTLDTLITDYEKSDNEQCDAFCCLIYNVHILGDHVATDSPKQLNPLVLEPLARYNDYYGILFDLKDCLKKLFPKHTDTYYTLISQLDILSGKANLNLREGGGIIETDENVKINSQLAKDTIDILAEYVPGLLKEEDFFKNSPLSK